MKINCPNCSENFKAMAAFQDHCQSVHGQDKDQIAIKCKHCKKTFESANACSKHIKIEHSHKCTFKSDIDKSQCFTAARRGGLTSKIFRTQNLSIFSQHMHWAIEN